jgi:hypothetical protein
LGRLLQYGLIERINWAEQVQPDKAAFNGLTTRMFAVAMPSQNRINYGLTDDAEFSVKRGKMTRNLSCWKL